MSRKTTSPKIGSEGNLSDGKAVELFIQLTEETLDDSYRDFLSKKKTCTVGTAKTSHMRNQTD